MNRFAPPFMVAAALISLALAEGPAPNPSAGIQFTNFASVGQAFNAGIAVDLDADGRFDVIERNPMRPFWNQGTNFLNGPMYNYTADNQFPIVPVVADFDNDSDVDIFYGRTEQSFRRSTAILWNRGKRVFTNQPAATFPSISFGSGAAADFDNDGDLDLLVTGFTNLTSTTIGKNIMRLYENFGGGELRESSQLFSGFEDGATAWADYDGDGDMDLLATGYTSNSFRGASILFRNDAGTLVNSQIALPALLNDTGVPVSAHWGDFDNDNDLDLLMAGATLNQSGARLPLAVIMRNDGATFAQVSFTTNRSDSSYRAVWADFNADGTLDIVLTGTTASPTFAFRGHGDGTFADPLPLSGGTVAGNPRLAFWNADAQPDLFTERFDFPLRSFRNESMATNTPPDAPSALVAIQNGGSVSFSWDPASDAEQTNGLTYNLRIGRTPGGSEVMSAMSNPTNGLRYIAALGNTGLRTNWTIRNFSVGTYYWSVQSIDRSYVGSRFAAEQSFTITNAPPGIDVIGITNLTASSATLMLRLQPNGGLSDYYVEFLSGGAPWTRISGQIDGEEWTKVNLLLPGLLSSTAYEVRVVASNLSGVSISRSRTFTTAPEALFSEIASTFPSLNQQPRFLLVDIDHNGYLDVIQSGLSNNVRLHRVFLNNAGVFTETTPLNITPTSLALFIDSVGDFNNDAQMDLVFATDGLGAAAYLNDRLDFTRRIMINNGRLEQIFPADSDNDGDLDVLTAGGPLGASLQLNDNIEESFRHQRIPRSALGQIAAWADYDDDGDNDLLFWGLTNEFQINPAQAVTRIFRNDLKNSFTEAQANLPGAWLGADWADFDNDGDFDVLLLLGTNALSSSTNEIKLFANEGTNGFVETQTVLTDHHLITLQAVDFNRDGLSDFAVRQDMDSGRDYLRLFQNTGSNFVELNLSLPPLTNFQARFADMDGDQLPDLVVQAQTTNSFQGRVRVFRNNLIVTNAPPPVPGELASEVHGISATLQWQLPPTPGITNNEHLYSFNLRVGNTPGGSEIMSAMAHPMTGARFLPQHGNAGQNGMWTLHDLPEGKYYWAVQTVDHSFNGSVFSAEQTFTVATENRPPQVFAGSPTNGVHVLTVDGPVRSVIDLFSSFDLVTWEPQLLRFYIGAEPATFSTGENDTRFYRFIIRE